MGPQVVKAETYDGDLADLRAFCGVVDRGSITAAALALGETKGSVSRRVRRLEQALGVELLRRTPRTVAPTEDGQQYRARLGRVLELLDAATAEVQHSGDAPSGHLRVTAPYDLATTTLAPMFVDFASRYPAISLDLSMTDVLLDFEKEQIDVAVRAMAALPDSTLIAHKLADASGGLYASPRYLAKCVAPRRPHDLANHPLIAMRGSRGQVTLTLHHRTTRKATKLKLAARISASDFSFCREAAVLGGGIAVLPGLLAQPDVDAGRLAPVLPAYVVLEAQLHLVYPAARFLAPKVRALRDHLLSAFGKRAPSSIRRDAVVVNVAAR